jgi:hypothetical protein
MAKFANQAKQSLSPPVLKQVILPKFTLYIKMMVGQFMEDV